MNLEAGKLSEEEKKKKEKSEKQKKLEQKKMILENKRKKEIKEITKTDEALNKLKDLIENDNINLSDIDKQVLEKAISGEVMSEKDIEKILSKIDEIESTDNVDKYLPKESRITKDEYQKALVDDKIRTKVMVKLDNALTILANQANLDSSMGLNLFSGYMAILDRKLVRIQENHIDIKENLEEVEVKKSEDKGKKMSGFKKFRKLFKDIFIN